MKFVPPEAIRLKQAGFSMRLFTQIAFDRIAQAALPLTLRHNPFAVFHP